MFTNKSGKSRATGTFIRKLANNRYDVKLMDRKPVPGSVSRRTHMSCQVEAFTEKEAKANAVAYFKKECQRQLDYYESIMRDLCELEKECAKGRHPMPTGPEIEEYLNNPKRGTIFDDQPKF